MAIAITLKEYLVDHGIAYDMIPHAHSATMVEAAHRANLPSDHVVKTVVLEDDEGYMLAAVPASHHVRLTALRKALNRRFGLATELDVARLFADCEPGAAPPVGPVYGLDVIVDDSLTKKSDIYFEGGDHCTLIHVRGEDFSRLMAQATHARISRPDRVHRDWLSDSDFV
jgi:Ala-tRNA(Pro) deacylase